MNHAPRLPLRFRALNVAGAALERYGRPGAILDPDQLIARACKQSGLGDFGDETFFGELQRLCEALREQAGLSFLGRQMASAALLQALRIQLEMQRCIASNPAIVAQPIRRPLIIVGMPRTGTTILHELLALDPANRAPRAWEVDAPCPPPQAHNHASDPRITVLDRRLAMVDKLVPQLRRMHRMSAELPQECVAITAHAFSSMQWSTTFRIPAYSDWLLHDADHASSYRFHQRFLQLLQWRYPTNRWLLKSPGHLWSLAALLRQYPDACLVQTHRDPLQIVSSLTSLVCTLRTMASDSVQPQAVASEWASTCAVALHASLRARQQGVVAPEQIVDLQFRDFMRDPAGTIAAIYERFGFEFSASFATAIARYIAANPADKHGRHRHNFASTGLDRDQERHRVADYQAYFGVESEV